MPNSAAILYEERRIFAGPMEGRFTSLLRNHLNSRLVLIVEVIFLLVRRSSTEVFLGKEILYQLEEEVPPGTKLADIMTDAGLTKLYKPQEIRKMTLRFNSNPAIPLFIKNGIVRTNGRIDRESIPVCQLRDPCELSVDVTVQPYEYFRVIKLIVEILDINDNPPTFQVAEDNDSAEVNILESVAQGTSVILPSANDPDSPRFGIAGYQLLMIAGMTTFHLKVTMKVDGVLEACLVVNEKLDRETTPFYSATLVAYDGGTPIKSASLNLMIVVLDANDNDPTFERNYYEARISENAQFNQTVVYLKAKDIDYGKNAEIRYSLTAQSPQSSTDSFGIDEETGRLFVQGPLDRELNDKSQIVVSARDLGVHSRQTNVLVTLHVDDVNDNSPEININSLSLIASNAASVPENAPPGTFIAHLTAVDRDLGENGTVLCYLQNNKTRPAIAEQTFRGLSETDLFYLEKQRLTLVRGEQEYHLLTTVPLDRETTHRYQVSITCADEGRPRLSSSTSIEIIVTDENDNIPTFASSEYVVTIPENSVPGSVITHMSATDPDAGKNGKLIYRVSGPLEEYFDIDTLGKIIISKQLSREKLISHKLEVVAVDNGEPRRSGTTLLTVNTNSDHLFSNSTYFFRVKENQPPGTKVGRVVIEEKNKFVKYEIKELQDFHFDAFLIDPKTGLLETNKVLDREIQPVYNFWVHRVPSESKTLNSGLDFQGTQPSNSLTKISVTVHVEDLNDNDPLFVFPSSNNYTVLIPSKTFKSGAVIAQVSAVDKDYGRNAEVEYKLKDCILSKSFHPDEFRFTNVKIKLIHNSTNSWLNSTLQESHEKNMSESHERNLVRDEVFVIDPNLGNVHVKKVEELNGDLMFHLTILAIDGGAPQRSSVALLTVIVNSTSDARWQASVRISNRTIALLGFVSGTCLVVGILTILIISIILFRRYFKRQPDKPPSQITDQTNSTTIKGSSASNSAFFSLNFSLLSTMIRCLALSTRSCLHRETCNQSQDDLLRRSVPCIQLNLDQGSFSSKLLEHSDRPTCSDTSSFCAVYSDRSPKKLSGLRSVDESEVTITNRCMTRKCDSMSYFSLESNEHMTSQGEARFFQSNWRQNLLPRCPQSMTFESSDFQSRDSKRNNTMEISHPPSKIDPVVNSDVVIQSYSSSDADALPRKVAFRCESESLQKQRRDRKDIDKQIERLTLPPPAQLPLHAIRQFNGSRFQQHKRPCKENKTTFMNVERHQMRPFKLTALKQVEESEII